MCGVLSGPNQNTGHAGPWSWHVLGKIADSDPSTAYLHVARCFPCLSHLFIKVSPYILVRLNDVLQQIIAHPQPFTTSTPVYWQHVAYGPHGSLGRGEPCSVRHCHRDPGRHWHRAGREVVFGR